VKNGVPFRVAFGIGADEWDDFQLESVERTAASIIFSELDGSEFDWRTMTWKERK
jgi:hypothetical protein